MPRCRAILVLTVGLTAAGCYAPVPRDVPYVYAAPGGPPSVDQHTGDRYVIVPSLRRQIVEGVAHLEPGMKADAVVALLGEPDRQNVDPLWYSGEPYPTRTFRYVLSIGSTQTYNRNASEIFMRFDRADRLDYLTADNLNELKFSSSWEVRYWGPGTAGGGPKPSLSAHAIPDYTTRRALGE